MLSSFPFCGVRHTAEAGGTGFWELGGWPQPKAKPLHHGGAETRREKINGSLADRWFIAVSSRADRRYFDLVSPAERGAHGKQSKTIRSAAHRCSSIGCG